MQLQGSVVGNRHQSTLSTRRKIPFFFFSILWVLDFFSENVMHVSLAWQEELTTFACKRIAHRNGLLNQRLHLTGMQQTLAEYKLVNTIIHISNLFYYCISLTKILQQCQLHFNIYSLGHDFWDILTQQCVSWRRFIIDMVHYILRHDP